MNTNAAAELLHFLDQLISRHRAQILVHTFPQYANLAITLRPGAPPERT
jgi:hypothetical protein